MKDPSISLPSEEEFLLMLQDRAFVDYFNVFLTQPVFGQRIMYRFHDRKFSFDPPIKSHMGRTFPDRVMSFLRTDRYPRFKMTSLSRDYDLCCQLRDIKHELVLCYREEQLDADGFKHLLEFLIGHVIGMQHFQRSLLGTSGHDSYCCWLDLEKFQNIPEEECSRREEQFRNIKARYMAAKAPNLLNDGKIAFGLASYVNFEVIPYDMRYKLDQEIGNKSGPITDDTFSLSNPETFAQLQRLLVTVLKCYWLPRYVIHVLFTTPRPVLREILQKSWKLEADGMALHAKLLFEQLFPRYGIELGLSFTPSVEILTESCLSEEEEPPPARPSFVDFQALEKAGVTADVFPSDALAKHDELKYRSPSLSSVSLRPEVDPITSGVQSGTDSRTSCASLWSQISHTDLASLHRPPTAYSIHTPTCISDSDTDEVLTESTSPIYTAPKYMRARDSQLTKGLSEEGNYWDDQAISGPNGSLNYALCLYMHGNADRDLSRYAKEHRHLVIAISAETLSGYPLRTFMTSEKCRDSVNYLDFWDAIREYLCAKDKPNEDPQPSAQSTIAARIKERFLSESSGDWSSVFNPNFKRFISHALLGNQDVGQLHTAQEVMLQSLQQIWKEYRCHDRQLFLHLACWKPNQRYMQRKKRLELDRTVLKNMKRYEEEERKKLLPEPIKPKPKVIFPSISTTKKLVMRTSESNSHHVDVDEGPFRPAPTSSRKWSSHEEVLAKDTIFESAEPSNHELNAGVSACSVREWHPDEADDTDNDIEEKDPLNEQHQNKAFELIVASLFPEVSVCSDDSTISDFYTILNSNYGSIAEQKRDVTRDKFLQRLLKPTRIKIADLKIKRLFLYEKPVIPTGLTYDPKTCMLKKDGKVIPRPPRPRSFKEVLVDPILLEYFSRFLITKRAAGPLQFWKAVQDMRETKSARGRNIKIQNIMRAFFNKKATRDNKLDCTEDVIKQIPQMDKNTATIMLCAQAAVYRSMERKWFYDYLETFPEEGEPQPMVDAPKRRISISKLEASFPELYDDTALGWRQGRLAKFKTLHRWRKLVHGMVSFVNATKHPILVKLFDIFLRIQLRRELEKKGKYKGCTYAELEYKTVLLNRLIVVNKLSRDLSFWVETNRFKALIDDTAQRTVKLPMAKSDIDNIKNKTSAILDCFLASEVPPKIQINIPTDMAQSVINLVMSRGPFRSVFHEAAINIFPILYHYWKKCKAEWQVDKLSDNDTLKLYDLVCQEMYGSMQDRSMPHQSVEVPNYNNLSIADYQSGVGYTEENRVRISFSLMHGIRIVFPMSLVRETKRGESRQTLGSNSRFGIAAAKTRRLSVMLKKRPSQTGHRESVFEQMTIDSEDNEKGPQLNNSGFLPDINSNANVSNIDDKRYEMSSTAGSGNAPYRSAITAATQESRNRGIISMLKGTMRSKALQSQPAQ